MGDIIRDFETYYLYFHGEGIGGHGSYSIGVNDSDLTHYDYLRKPSLLLCFSHGVAVSETQQVKCLLRCRCRSREKTQHGRSCRNVLSVDYNAAEWRVVCSLQDDNYV